MVTDSCLMPCLPCCVLRAFVRIAGQEVADVEASHYGLLIAILTVRFTVTSTKSACSSFAEKRGMKVRFARLSFAATRSNSNLPVCASLPLHHTLPLTLTHPRSRSCPSPYPSPSLQGARAPKLMNNFEHLLLQDAFLPATQAVMRGFQANLTALAATIDARNAVRRWPFNGFHPQRLLTSVSI